VRRRETGGADGVAPLVAAHRFCPAFETAAAHRKRNLTIRFIPVPLLLGTVAFITQKRRDKQVPNLKPQGLRLRLIGMTLAGS
jgi:hypothetical protein